DGAEGGDGRRVGGGGGRERSVVDHVGPGTVHRMVRHLSGTTCGSVPYRSADARSVQQCERSSPHCYRNPGWVPGKMVHGHAGIRILERGMAERSVGRLCFRDGIRGEGKVKKLFGLV